MQVFVSILKRPVNYLITATSILWSILAIGIVWDLFEIKGTPVSYMLSGVAWTLLVPFIQYQSIKEWRSME